MKKEMRRVAGEKERKAFLKERYTKRETAEAQEGRDLEGILDQ